MKLAIFPGSFKPPHKGHYLLVKKLLEDKSIDKIYIIISNKPRYLLPENEKSGSVSDIESEELWKIYFPKELGKTKDRRLYMMVSTMPSPIMMAYAIADRMLKKGDELILVKSSKDENNSRFSSFKNMKKRGIKVDVWSIPKYEALSSTNMRKEIYDKDKKKFMKFLPDKLDNKDKNKIWNAFI